MKATYLILFMAMFPGLDSPGMAGSDIAVLVEAKPSQDCFPASSLQQQELLEELRAICSECVSPDSDESPQFRIVVEDPGMLWKITIYNSKGALLETFTWNGCLRTGLRRAVSILRNVSIPAPGLAGSGRAGASRFSS